MHVQYYNRRRLPPEDELIYNVTYCETLEDLENFRRHLSQLPSRRSYQRAALTQRIRSDEGRRLLSEYCSRSNHR